MRTRAWVAAVAGSAAAAAGHALDAAGQLPFVHETTGVRLAMQPAAVLLWLAAAAALAALAASTRPVLLGAPAAVAVSAAPELWGRGDPGALVEPGALLGALLQLLLVLLVVVLAVACERLPAVATRSGVTAPAAPSPSPRRTSLVGCLVGTDARPRGPPLIAL